jgi:hypothetical protein
VNDTVVFDGGPEPARGRVEVWGGERQLPSRVH